MPNDPARCGKNALLGVILCGGASSRMGADKATLLHSGRMLWQHVTERLESQVTQLVISTSTGQHPPVFAPFSCTEDLHSNLGPLSGISSTLESQHLSHFDWLVITSCDTPCQPYNWVKYLTDASKGRPGIYFIQSGGRDHYLHALWHRMNLAPLREFLQAGGRAVRAFYAQNNAQAVAYPEGDGIKGDPFFNLNTPDDFSRLHHAPKP